MLGFQRLEVYRLSIEFHGLLVRCTRERVRGYRGVVDQVRRAASSVPLNIAEASGRLQPGEAAHHFAIARGSAMECAAVLDVSRTLGLIGEDNHAEGISQLERVVAMLTRLCR